MLLFLLVLILFYCLACEAEGEACVLLFVVNVVVVVGGVNFLCLGQFFGNYKGYSHETWVMHTS